MKDLNALKNKKIFFLPVNTGFGLNGNPDFSLIDFYQQRSGNGIYCSIVGNVVIPNGHGSNEHCLYISNSEKWKDLSDAMNNNNSLAGIQLSSTWPNYIGNKKFVASSPSAIDNYLLQLNSLTIHEIDTIMNQLEKAIELSIGHGFKHIQLHAGHGYLFSLLLDNIFCDKSLYALNKIRSTFSQIPKYIEKSLRFSLLVGMQKIDKQRESTIQRLLELPFDYFDISFGFYNINKHMIYPETKSMLTSRINKSIELSNSNPKKQFIISGRSFNSYKEKLPDNVHVGICRDIIANPYFLNNTSEGCNLCGQCHYYSRGETYITCGQW